MITILASPRAPHQVIHATAMAAGLLRHGLRTTITHRAPRTGPDDTVICWGWRHGQEHHGRGAQVLVMERGYIGDRFNWTSLAWNGLNNRGEFPIVEDSGERFRRYFDGTLKPWNPEGEYTLICGQVPGDMSLQGRDLHKWYEAQAERHSPVFFRPHPLAHRRETVKAVRGAPFLNGRLEDALERAALVVTWNSNAGVDALLAGKPTHVEDLGGMAYGIDETTRERWAHRLAWRQFTLEEMTSGLAWEVANRG
jgi:hypothetical protein